MRNGNLVEAKADCAPEPAGKLDEDEEFVLHVLARNANPTTDRNAAAERQITLLKQLHGAHTDDRHE